MSKDGEIISEDDLQALHQSIEQLNSANLSSFQQNEESGKERSPSACNNRSNRKRKSTKGSQETLVDVQTQTPKKRKRRKVAVPTELLDTDNPIDEILEDIAHRKNLTTNNVKHLLKNIIAHESVQEMLKCSLDSSMRMPFEPKLTRSKTKEWLETQNLPCWPPSAKKSSGAQLLMEEEFPEDSSSDDEYR